MSMKDEDILKNHLMDLRGQARVYAAAAEDHENPDVRVFMKGSSEDYFRLARALHRFMAKNGVRGLGPLNY